MARALTAGLVGAALGLAGGFAGAWAIAGLLPPELPLFARPSIDWCTVVAAVVGALTATAVAALAGISASLHAEPAVLLADAGARGTTEPRSRTLFLRIAVAVELALALGLAAAGMLTARGYGNLLGRPRNFSSAGLDLATIKFSSGAQAMAFVRHLPMPVSLLTALVPVTSLSRSPTPLTVRRQDPRAWRARPMPPCRPPISHC